MISSPNTRGALTNVDRHPYRAKAATTTTATGRAALVREVASFIATVAPPESPLPASSIRPATLPRRLSDAGKKRVVDLLAIRGQSAWFEGVPKRTAPALDRFRLAV